MPNILATLPSQPNFAGTLLINDVLGPLLARSDDPVLLTATLTAGMGTSNLNLLSAFGGYQIPQLILAPNATLVDCTISFSCTREFADVPDTKDLIFKASTGKFQAASFASADGPAFTFLTQCAVQLTPDPTLEGLEIVLALDNVEYIPNCPPTGLARS